MLARQRQCRPHFDELTDPVDSRLPLVLFLSQLVRKK